MLTKIKSKIAPHILSAVAPLIQNSDDLISLLETPKKLDHGELALPVFSWAKELRKAPPVIALEFAQKINDKKIDILESVTPVGGYINFVFKTSFLQNILSEATARKNIGYNEVLKNETVIIDYSSPNVAKPMSVGHLRATVIGQAIRNLAESQGYKVLGLNHLGDWGIQFGKLAWAYENWGKEYEFEEKPFDSLYQIYVRFHEEAEENPDLNKKGAEYFQRLEAGDEDVEKIWRYFLDVSLKEYDRIYKMLGIKFDLTQGESFYNDLLEPTVERIKKAGILEESQGAQVVFVGDDLPPCIIKKSDGSSLYATRDLASAMYRHEVLKGQHILYVVGVDQNLHFKQVFRVLERMGFDWAKNCHHIAFGMYGFKDIGKMSTRKGNVIFMDDVLEKAIEMVRQVIEQKNPDLENKELVAKQVGIGAIIFNDLMNDRIKNVDFDWTRVLDFEGDSGPYVQYGQVRCNSLIKKYGKEINREFEVELTSNEERNLIKTLLNYDEVLSNAYRTYRPNVVTQFLLDVCRAFNHFYQKQKILTGDPALLKSRMTLVLNTRDVLVAGLKILGIESPEVM